MDSRSNLLSAVGRVPFWLKPVFDYTLQPSSNGRNRCSHWP
jgi:hypothetical protein